MTRLDVVVNHLGRAIQRFRRMVSDSYERGAALWQVPLIQAQSFALRQVWSRPQLAWLQPLKLDSRHGRRRVRVRQLLQSNYDLLVDGFPRSGTSLTAAAIGEALPDISVRSHCHQPTHVLQAILHHRRPAVVLVRDPTDAVPSAARHYGWTLERSAARYCAYYRALIPHAANLLIVPFPAATGCLEEVIQGVLRRLGRPSACAFGGDLPAKAAERVRSLPWGASEATVSLPSAARNAATSGLRAKFLDSAGLVSITCAAHDDFTRAGRSSGTIVPP
jgi:hypothetical protein